MTHYFLEPRKSKFVKGYGFLSFANSLSKKWKKVIGHRNKNRTRC